MTDYEMWIEAAENCEREAARLLEGAKQWRENAANGVPQPPPSTLRVLRTIDERESQPPQDAIELSGVSTGTSQDRVLARL
jgi:hypothetical protein